MGFPEHAIFQSTQIYFSLVWCLGLTLTHLEKLSRVKSGQHLNEMEPRNWQDYRLHLGVQNFLLQYSWSKIRTQSGLEKPHLISLFSFRNLGLTSKQDKGFQHTACREIVSNSVKQTFPGLISVKYREKVGLDPCNIDWASRPGKRASTLSVLISKQVILFSQISFQLFQLYSSCYCRSFYLRILPLGCKTEGK